MRLTILLGSLVAAAMYFSEPEVKEEGVRVYNEHQRRIEYISREEYLAAPNKSVFPTQEN